MQEVILSKKFIIPTVAIACLYIVFAIYLMNMGLLKSTFLSEYGTAYKLNLLVALLGGMWTAMSKVGLAMLVITALLTGANLTLVVQRIKSLRSSGNLRFVVGGGSILGFIGSGCAACGLPILALLGLSGSVIYLPLRGLELSLLSIGLLLISLYIMLKNSSSKEKVCKIN